MTEKIDEYIKQQKLRQCLLYWATSDKIFLKQNARNKNISGIVLIDITITSADFLLLPERRLISQ